MRVFSGILIQLGQLVKSKLWMVSQGDVPDQNPEVVIIQEGRSNLYIQSKPKNECIACGTLYQVRECPVMSSVCFKCNKQGHFSRLCQSTTISTPSSNRNRRGSWHGRGRGSNRSNRDHGSKCAVYEAETSDTSKPIIDATNSEVYVVKLLQAYGMVPTEGSELKHRRTKKVATDEISVVPIQTLK